MYRTHNILTLACLAVIGVATAVDLRAEVAATAPADAATESPSPADRLQPLEWLIGEWVGRSSNGVVLVSSRWSDSSNYIVREFLVEGDDGEEVGGTQRVGWDPLKQRIKCWSFDSQGGSGEGFWRRDGAAWVVESTEVTADGQTSKATATYTPIDDERFAWEVKSARLPGVPLPTERIEFKRAKDE